MYVASSSESSLRKTDNILQYPATAKFLTESERAHVVAMLKADSRNMATHFSWKFVFQALRDYKTYVQIVIYMG